MQNSQRKYIFLSRLKRVMRLVSHHSIVEKKDEYMSYDYERAIPIINKLGLQGHIYFRHKKHGKIPLNSEKHIYDINNIIIKRLHIRVTSELSWSDYSDREPIFSAKWHFEDCIFESDYYSPISFPWRGDFRLYKNNFISTEAREPTSWGFYFEKGTRIAFHKNCFNNSELQISSTINGEMIDPSPNDFKSASLQNLMMSGNREIGDLMLRCSVRQYVITGINQINRLTFLNGQYMPTKLYLGPREQIDPYFDHTLYHRGLFLSLKKLSIEAHDTQLTNSLDKHLDRIEYHLVKSQRISIFDGLGNWVQHWQDRVLCAWRRWSTDFYRSWLRPLVLLISGYIVLNACPLLFIDSFSFSDWSEFTLREIHKIPFYTDSLREILNSRYDEFALWQRNLLRLTGIIQATWIGLWSFALFKSIKR